MRIKTGGCNCAHCQFLTKVVIFVNRDSSEFDMASKFPGDLELSDAKFYFIMDARANVPLDLHAQQWQ